MTFQQQFLAHVRPNLLLETNKLLIRNGKRVIYSKPFVKSGVLELAYSKSTGAVANSINGVCYNVGNNPFLSWRDTPILTSIYDIHMEYNL